MLIRLAFHATRSCWWINGKSFTVVCRNFLSWNMAAKKHWEIRIAYRLWRSNFPRKEGKPIYERKTESYVFSGFSNGIARGWERKSTTGGFATARFWLCTWKISSVGKEKLNNWELWILKITPMIQGFFLYWALSSTHFTIFIRGLSILLSSFVNKKNLSCQLSATVFIL